MIHIPGDERQDYGLVGFPLQKLRVFLQMNSARPGPRGWQNNTGRHMRADGVPDMALLSLNEVCMACRASKSTCSDRCPMRGRLTY
jgi:hypothetical protein